MKRNVLTTISFIGRNSSHMEVEKKKDNLNRYKYIGYFYVLEKRVRLEINKKIYNIYSSHELISFPVIYQIKRIKNYSPQRNEEMNRYLLFQATLLEEEILSCGKLTTKNFHYFKKVIFDYWNIIEPLSAESENQLESFLREICYEN